MRATSIIVITPVPLSVAPVHKSLNVQERITYSSAFRPNYNHRIECVFQKI